MANAAHTRLGPKLVERASLPDGRALVFAGNGQKHLVALKRQIITAATPQKQAVWRYAYDQSQRRVLSQQGVVQQSDLASNTQTQRFQPNAHRLSKATYNANGQPQRISQREFVWDALGRLIEVREQAHTVARYRHDHRGLRIAKEVGQAQTLYLHDESRQPLADLDAQGRITRQYIWLADLPIAVIDTPADLAAERPGIEQVFKDLTTAIQSWFDDHEGITWLHTNHLGAPELATNAQGDVVWRASYSPFGEAKVSSQHNFTLNLRLPGQLFDPETGLHYNRQRIYDPELGQYLTPDPLGTPDGPNPYAYVAFNPLTNIDPDGLVLFAFDGTGNDEDSRTNVINLAQAYSDRDEYYTAPGQSTYQWRQFYIEGVGTRGGLGDNTFTGGALALQMRGRIDDQLAILDEYVIDRYSYYRDRNFRGAPISRDNPLEYDIDITGFSRGAASARDFANQIISRQNAGYFRNLRGIDGGCVRVKIRFMGLFDTVQSFTVGNFNLGVPEAVGYVAHAVARNEYRSQFPLESIEAGTSNTGFASNRIERAFVGAHSDVGGGYNGVGARQGDGGDLSDVALNWMLQQAQAQGLQFNELPDELRVVSNPIVHDETTAGVFFNPSPTRDREVRYVDGSRANGRQAPLEGMTHTESLGLIQYAQCTSCPVNQVGHVDMPAYLQWLREHSADYGNINVRP